MGGSGGGNWGLWSRPPTSTAPELPGEPRTGEHSIDATTIRHGYDTQAITDCKIGRTSNGCGFAARVYNRALSASEVLDIYKAGSSGKVFSPIAVSDPSVVNGSGGATTPVTFTITPHRQPERLPDSELDNGG